MVDDEIRIQLPGRVSISISVSVNVRVSAGIKVWVRVRIRARARVRPRKRAAPGCREPGGGLAGCAAAPLCRAEGQPDGG